MKKDPYMHSFEYSMDKNEDELYTESHLLDLECSKAWSAALSSSVNEKRLFDAELAVKSVVEEYGAARPAQLLAATILNMKNNENIDPKAVAWAENIPYPMSAQGDTFFMTHIFPVQSQKLSLAAREYDKVVEQIKQNDPQFADKVFSENDFIDVSEISHYANEDNEPFVGLAVAVNEDLLRFMYDRSGANGHISFEERLENSGEFLKLYADVYMDDVEFNIIKDESGESYGITLSPEQKGSLVSALDKAASLASVRETLSKYIERSEVAAER